MIDWKSVSGTLRKDADRKELGWQFGQEQGLRWLAAAIGREPGVLIADEVGLGKTRIAMAAIHAVSLERGRVAVIVPPTLLHQWEREHAELASLRDPAKKKDNADARERRQLRTFLDVFSDGNGNAIRPSSYPLSKGQPFVLISHSFGLGQRIGSGVGPYAWAFPYIVRSFIEHGTDNWQGAKGLKEASAADQRLNCQLPAARWLSNNLTKDLKAQLSELPPLNEDAGSHFSLRNDLGENSSRRVFHKLIGRLIGPIDLILIDEAHKS